MLKDYLRRSRSVRMNILFNTSMCKGLFRTRYENAGASIDEPKITGPLDVIVRIGGAGVCRTDLHIIEGQWAEKSNVKLPYTIGHENAGWVHEVGAAVSNVAVGDTIIVHPLITCGFCRACRAGDDMHCANQSFPGISVDGGMANFLKTTARAVAKLQPDLQPKDIAALADAGLTAYLVELMTLTSQGKVALHTAIYPLDAALDAIHDLDTGKLRGRGILVP